ARGGRVRGALARGLGVLALLSLLFVLVVYLRIWTEAGKAVLGREGLLTLSHWGVALGVLGGLGALLLSRAPGPQPASWILPSIGWEGARSIYARRGSGSAISIGARR